MVGGVFTAIQAGQISSGIPVALASTKSTSLVAHHGASMNHQSRLSVVKHGQCFAGCSAGWTCLQREMVHGAS